ncbi:PREDICTED: vitellogenin-3-like [Cyphomyrmex costatus]|uniref:vitellogenin-3-like n=1 Tax=Cyphomyrmex costatus TaxID=456900 RepID=UPI000852395D|nr:PREDICTED: vitellogenin-3-like [Cyphomyrmex costatus]
MWFPVTLLLLAGVAVVTSSSDHKHAWEMGNEYEYLVRSRTVAGLDKLKEQYTGVQIKAKLIIQVKSPEILQMKLSNPQYARLHTTLMDGPDTELPDNMLEYLEIPMSGKTFAATLKHGVIRNLLIDRNVPTWELNLLKSIMSQLQIDTQGENAIRVKSAQVPMDENSSVMFTAVEDSVGGKCEVLYEISPLTKDAYLDKVPLPNLRGEENYYEVTKLKNYEKCMQRQIYHYGLEDPLHHNHGKLYTQDKMFSEISTTQMILSGNLREFTIQSVVTNNQISVRPGKTDPFIGNVYSILKLNLVKMNKLSSLLLGPHELINLESTGNLIYTYNNPLSDSENPMLPSISINSEQMRSSESSERNMDDQDSSASSSSREDHTLYKSNISPMKMAMYMVRRSPLLPVTNMDRIEDLIHEMAVTVNLSNDTKLSVTERYVFLKNLVRTMNLKQIGELEERVSHNHRIQDKDYKNIVWSIIRDAITQAGTRPALLTIQNWLKNKRVEGLEAARIVSQIPKHTQEPTKEYVRTFYEILMDPSILNQTPLNMIAPLAFAEILRKSYVGISHPMRLERMTLRDNNDIVNLYIPYLARELKQSLIENNSLKTQTYIMALGRIGHPMIISVLEPYIEKTEPVSQFQRWLMVSSLATLGISKPKLVGPILYKLYLNVHEDHKIRCMAIHRYIMSNPPLIKLQRIAKSTHYELNENLNSIIKSTIKSLAMTKRPELQDLAIKARSVRHLLNLRGLDKWNSIGYYTDLDVGGIRGLNLQTVMDDDNIIPAFMRIAMNTAFDFYGLATMEAEHAVSSVRQLLDHLNIGLMQNEETDQEMHKSRIEKLMRVLQLKTKQLDKLEGHIYVNTIFETLFYPYDGRTLQMIFSQLKDSLKRDQQWDSVLFNNYETTLSFPTESGLPFMYTLESPMIIKQKAEMKNDELSLMKRTGIISMYMANKVQKQFGFIVPFEHQHYIAGIDVNRMMQLPLQYEIELDSSQKLSLGRLKIRPLPQTQMSPMTVLHLSTIPFTTRQNHLDLQPLSLSKNTHLVLIDKKHKTLLDKDLISIRLESDDKEIEEFSKKSDITQMILELLIKLRAIPSGQYRKLDILMNPEQLVKSILQVNIIHEKMAIDTKLLLPEELSLADSPIMIPLKNVKPNSEKRRKEIMTGLSRGLNSGDVHVLDINLNLPALQKHQIITIGWVDSNVDKKSKAYMYWNSQMSMKEKPLSEICYMHEMQDSTDTPLNFERMMKHAPKSKIRAELQYGENCHTGNKLVIDASMSRSDLMKDLLENSRIVKQCWEDIRKGRNVLQACQQAIELARVKNQADISVRGSIIDYIEKMIEKIADFLSHLLPHSRIKLTNPKDSDTSTYDIKMTMSPLDVVPPAYLDSPRDVTVPNMEHTNFEMQELLKENAMLRKEEKRASCTIDKNMILTFDKLLYPVTLGTCKHVLMTTYPQRDPDIPRNKTNMGVLALLRDVDGTKYVDLLMEMHEISLKKINDDFNVEIDGNEITLLLDKSYRLRENDETILEIIKLPDHSVEIFSDKSDIRILYDGERIQLLVTDKYRNALRGLCGNYDSNPSTDFLTPQNCLVKIPEVFTATYALTEEDCPQKYIMDNKQKAELMQCQQLPMQQWNNVINDVEAGRIPSYEHWGYHHNNLKRKLNLNNDKPYSLEKHDLPAENNIVYRTKVILEDENICFTSKPIPVCLEGTRPMERTTRKYDLYCQPRNEESLIMKRRIEQGANPDFTRKPITRLHTFQVPVVCNA